MTLTILLGICFTCVQAWEYAHAPFAFKNSIYGATFFMATGFHGAHVIIGTIFLIVCLVARPRRPVHAGAASRLRVRRLVLALRRRGVAVPVLLHLCLGLVGRDDRGSGGVIDSPPPPARSAGAPWPSEAGGGASLSPFIDRPARAAARAAARGGCSRGFLTVAPKCDVCGLDLGFADAGDGPAVFVTLIGGFLVLGAALAVEMAYEPPLWVYLVVFAAARARRLPRPAAAVQGVPDRRAIRQRAAPGRLEEP